jgi:6-phosphogluconolactonase
VILHRHEDAPAVAAAAADAVAEWARRACAERGRFRIALSGGSTPKLLYERLASAELGAGIDWRRWHVFFSDERCVPPDRPESNYHMARGALFSRVPLPESNVHRILGELDPESAALAYEAELGAEPLDLVLLGMGDDGHTASLFPGTSALDERGRRVVAAKSPVKPFERVTFTFRTIGEARRALFLVTGAGKAERLAQVLAQRESAQPLLPAARVRLEGGGALDLYVDDAAAARLPE